METRTAAAVRSPSVAGQNGKRKIIVNKGESIGDRAPARRHGYVRRRLRSSATSTVHKNARARNNATATSCVITTSSPWTPIVVVIQSSGSKTGLPRPPTHPIIADAIQRTREKARAIVFPPRNCKKQKKKNRYSVYPCGNPIICYYIVFVYCSLPSEPGLSSSIYMMGQYGGLLRKALQKTNVEFLRNPMKVDLWLTSKFF